MPHTVEIPFKNTCSNKARLIHPSPVRPILLTQRIANKHHIIGYVLVHWDMHMNW